jgi:hypothetical protein
MFNVYQLPNEKAAPVWLPAAMADPDFQWLALFSAIGLFTSLCAILAFPDFAALMF